MTGEQSVEAETVIHPSAAVEDGAVLGAGVRIGPFCHIGANVELGDGVEIGSHVSILGRTIVGEATRIAAHAALGGPPGDVKHGGSLTGLRIGRNCDIREFVTMHAGSDRSSGLTSVGDNGLFLATAHVAHDCRVGDGVTMVNGAVLAGHCEIGDGVTIGGLTAVQQFARIGRRAFLGGCSAIVGDVIPFGIASGNKARLRGFNLIGMKRSGMSRAELTVMREAYDLIFAEDGLLADNVRIAGERYAGVPVVAEIVDFLSTRGKRQFVLPPRGVRAQDDDGAV